MSVLSSIVNKAFPMVSLYAILSELAIVELMSILPIKAKSSSKTVAGFPVAVIFPPEQTTVLTTIIVLRSFRPTKQSGTIAVLCCAVSATSSVNVPIVL